MRGKGHHVHYLRLPLESASFIRLSYPNESDQDTYTSILLGSSMPAKPIMITMGSDYEPVETQLRQGKR